MDNIHNQHLKEDEYKNRIIQEPDSVFLSCAEGSHSPELSLHSVPVAL